MTDQPTTTAADRIEAGNAAMLSRLGIGPATAADRWKAAMLEVARVTSEAARKEHEMWLRVLKQPEGDGRPMTEPATAAGEVRDGYDAWKALDAQERTAATAATEWDVLHRLAAILEHDRTLKPTSYGCACVNHAERKRLFSAAEKVVRGILAMSGAGEDQPHAKDSA